MSAIENATFVVQRGDTQFSCLGSELKGKLQDDDLLLAQRGDTHGSVVKSSIHDDDLLIVTDGDNGHKSVIGVLVNGLFPDPLKLITDVEFDFDSNNAIVITQNAEATDGEPPYVLTTEYDITLGDNIVTTDLPSRVPVSADILNGNPYISFGRVDTTGSTDPQEIYSFDVKTSDFVLKHDTSGAALNNRFGLKRLKFEGKEIIIDVYNDKGTLGVTSHQFVYLGLDQSSDTGMVDESEYGHLNGDGSASRRPPCAGVLSDKDGTLYTAWYGDGIYKHTNVQADALGYPDLQDSNITKSKITVPIHYFKGIKYHEETDGFVYSNTTFVYYNTTSGDSYKLNSNSLATDDFNSVALAFTSTYAVRTVISANGLVSDVSYGVIGNRSTTWGTASNKLYINDSDNKYLFMIEGGERIKMLDYNYTGDPFDGGAPWEELRTEELPPGTIGGHGAITLEPFNIMWYQDNKLKDWGSIPEPGTDATVTQTITDTAGDSVSSSDTKTVPTASYPWDGHDGGIFHVKNATETIDIEHSNYQVTAYNIDGTLVSTHIRSFGPGDEYVLLTPPNSVALFFQLNGSSGTWEFGEFTDTRKVTNMSQMFKNCGGFSRDLSGWCLHRLMSFASNYSNFAKDAGFEFSPELHPKFADAPNC